jgi:hypothetical protein
MAQGGKRPGAGRPRGARNKTAEAVRQKAAATGITPLDYMLKVLRNEGEDEKRRDAMAIAAAPYIHPKLASTHLTGEIAVTHEDRLKELA